MKTKTKAKIPVKAKTKEKRAMASKNDDKHTTPAQTQGHNPVQQPAESAKLNPDQPKADEPKPNSDLPKDFKLAPPGSRDYVAGQPVDEAELKKANEDRAGHAKPADDPHKK